MDVKWPRSMVKRLCIRKKVVTTKLGYTRKNVNKKNLLQIGRI